MSFANRRAAALLVLVVTAGLAAGSCSGEASESPSSTSSIPADTVADADELYRWRVGDCILIDDPEDLPYEPYGTGVLVDCGEPHAYEVFFTGVFEGDQEAPFPEDASDQIRETCVEAFLGFAGRHLSESSLDILMYLPDPDEWAQGLRYQACAAFDPGSGGEVPLTSGTLRGQAGATPRPSTGGCLRQPAGRGEAVDCTKPHHAEIIGTFTHPAGAGDPYPGLDRFQADADAACRDLLTDYAVEPPTGPQVFPVAIGEALTGFEWSAGLRSTPCVALVIDAERDPLLVVGSLSESGWWVLKGARAV